jgi:hypothetical protein
MEIRRANPANPEVLWHGDVVTVPRVGDQVSILDDAGHLIAHQCTGVQWLCGQDYQLQVTVEVRPTRC